MELRHGPKREDHRLYPPLNRTYMELRLEDHSRKIGERVALNRTYMELRLYQIHHFHKFLIRSQSYLYGIKTVCFFA